MSIPIIFLAFANEVAGEKGHLGRLLDEKNDILSALKGAQSRGHCEIVVLPNAEVKTFLDIFQEKDYHDRIAIFHFGGHADSFSLFLNENSGDISAKSSKGLISILQRRPSLKLVFLNGCSTEKQAEELIEGGIPLVIGTSSEIQDEVAKKIAVRFYKGLNEGLSIDMAWKDAEDEMFADQKGKNFRGFYRDRIDGSYHDKKPWKLYHQDKVQNDLDWNLADAVEDYLFGIPEISEVFFINLPNKPA